MKKQILSNIKLLNLKYSQEEHLFGHFEHLTLFVIWTLRFGICLSLIHLSAPMYMVCRLCVGPAGVHQGFPCRKALLGHSLQLLLLH